MEFNLDKPTPKISILNRITLVLIAIFLTTTLFAGLQKAFNNLGLLLGLIFSIALQIQLLKKSPGKGSWQNIVAYSVMFTIIVSVVGMIAAYFSLSYLIDSTF